MKRFKYLDIVVSWLCILAFGADYLRGGNHLAEGYLVTGGWQSCSMLVHGSRHWFTGRRGLRFYYHWLTVLLLLTFPLGSYWVLWCIAPFLALFYTGLCMWELSRIRPRPLSLLK
ncbi:MAG TPA: hypothetical protein VG870_09795 [Chitinophagaceae bacterium]|nr:hypothetical protein [Chitinophagaceae bacterium]